MSSLPPPLCLKEAHATLEEALATLQTLALMAEPFEAARLVGTCERLVAHMMQVRRAM
jgi:hypothetical protein